MADMLDARIAKTPDMPALKSKIGGNWSALSWKEFGDRALLISYGLMALGMELGDRVCILAATREEWMISDFGIVGGGGVTVPIYASSLPRQCTYIINNCTAAFIFANDSQQLKKLLGEKEKTPDLKKVILFGGDSEDDWVISYKELLQLGRNKAEELREEYQRRRTLLDEETPVTIIYTSGATGDPKGAALPNRAFTSGCVNALKSLPINEEDEQLLFLPLAHSFAKMLAIASVSGGMTISFAEGAEKVVKNLAELNPTIMASVPRVFEKVYQKIFAQVENAGAAKKKIFLWALEVGKKHGKYRERREKPPFLLNKQYQLAEKLVFNNIRKRFGNRLRWFISGGAPLSKDIAEFFHAAGVIILEGYGMTENNSLSSINRPSHYKFGTVGLPHVGIEIKIAPDGEILQRGDSNMLGYFNNSEATFEILDEDGWLHTGDIGEIDKEGFVKITDRKKDIIVTTGGKNISPQNLENLIETSKYISRVMVYGDKRKYLVALVALEPGAVKKYAKEHALTYTNTAELSRADEIHNLIQKEIETINSRLAPFEKVKNFKILPTDFSLEEDELTPSMKIKRKNIVSKYKEILDSMYQKLDCYD